MTITFVTVSFEFTDAHISIADDGTMIDGFEEKCIKLCEIFDFEYKLNYRRLDCTPHWVFDITFQKSIFTYQHYMNVLQAFAQEFQILMAAAREENYEYSL